MVILIGSDFMKNPPHRAWLVCLGGALAMFAVMGLGVNVFSIYQPEIIRLNGFTDAQGSCSSWPPCCASTSCAPASACGGL